MGTLRDLNIEINKLAAGLARLEAALQRAKLKPATDIDYFRHAEYLAHVLPYTLDARKSSQETTIQEPDGKKYKYVAKLVKDTHNGLVCFVLYSKDKLNPKVQVLFRGTHNAHSIKRDLETFGISPGKNTFETDKVKVMRTIKKIVSAKQESSNIPIELTIAGHSLGGADAQNCAAAIFEDMHSIKYKKPSPLAALGSLNIMHANSAGVSQDTALKCKRLLPKIMKTHSTFKVKQQIIMVGGDAIQQGGYTTILADAPKEYVRTKLLKADIGVENKYSLRALILQGAVAIFKGIKPKDVILGVVNGMRDLYSAHTFLVFDEKNPHKKAKTVKSKVTFTIYDNERRKDKLVIEKELKTKVLRRIYKSFKRSLSYFMPSTPSPAPKPKPRSRKT